MTGSSAATLAVGGLTPLTTIDYPGELAAVVYCRGCPWRCRYCHNGHLLDAAKEAEQLPWDAVMAFLASRRGLLDAVVLSGGEPTAQVALADAITDIRALGFRIGLHTGGPYPERLASVLPLVDWVGLDIKALPADYPAVTGVPGSGERAWRSLDLLLDAGVAHEVRTTPLPGLDDAGYLQRLMQRLADTGVERYVLQHCDTTHALDASLKALPAAVPPPLAADLSPPPAMRHFSVRAR
ncbi:anaerobic ribonucleoside-triphosphate reductase activating protein [Thiohalocapsa marina]|uniref:Anaerobic ribonucleoside-triphosphate reductase activating protein n=1 Tax=Thiohalocapsa marina TaxID=424902 RepID=A0A5M8FR13_9GAMM|nr:anaerobic ribonucleoside-triphosphate reductase activating protein [Thiohalocapsa marina]KAA6186720.1 anaerobic ribonucleoside-triphosphate reductase activating protein [Thiohalocapsa marina]